MKVLQKFSPLFMLLIIFLGSCEQEKYDFDKLAPTVKSFYTVSTPSANMGVEINFKNESQNANTYSWDFGDGTSSTDASPSKSYTVAGIYNVVLKAVGAGGTGTYSQTVTIVDPDAGQSKMVLYFIEYNTSTIKKIPLKDGSKVETVVDITDMAGVGLAYDPVSNKIYMSDFENSDEGKIWVMDVDGSNKKAIVSGLNDPYSVVIDSKGKKVYWADDDGNIGRANLDGTALERSFVQVEDGQMRGIAIDGKSNKVYFYEVNNEDLYAVSLNGGTPEKVISGAYGYCIFIDEENGKIYYEDRNQGAIMQANLNGSGIVKFADAPGTRIFGMGIDYSKEKFYWADRDKGLIKRANLDGTGVESFLTGLKSPRGLFIK